MTTTAQQTRLRAAWNFFRANAGYATPPGPAACALELAKAERHARTQDWRFAWFPDEDCVHPNEPGPCEVAVLYGEANNDEEPRPVLASMGCIHEATNAYRRVVEAELAAEAMANEESD
jgi:hypothetical protein